MIEFNQAAFKVEPFPHQLEGVRALIKYPFFALFDSMGVGKSKQVVDAACLLADAGTIECLVVVCPAAVRPVWLDPEFGEVVKHSWVPTFTEQYCARNDELGNGVGSQTKLHVVVTSYEFIRQASRCLALEKFLRRHPTMLVLDESSFVKNHRAQQTRSCFRLASCASRRVILNGTPIANSPMDLYSQLAMLDKRVLGYSNFYAFRNRHAVMGGWQGKQVVGFRDLELVRSRIAPYCLRRKKEDCLQLEPKAYSRAEVPLSAETWRVYREMRDEMVAFLGTQTAITTNAAVKLLRLCQITSGFLGGVAPTPPTDGDLTQDYVSYPELTGPVELSADKTDYLLTWLHDRLAEDPSLKCIVWCRFRAEIERLHRRLMTEHRFSCVMTLQGGQGQAEREAAISLMSPDHDGQGSAVLVAQPQAGRFGLNLAGASTAVYLSNDFNLMTRQQSEDRIHRPGQVRQTYFLDVLATGPSGQRTVDHKILKAHLKKQNIAAMTVDQWRKLLSDEEEGW